MSPSVLVCVEPSVSSLDSASAARTADGSLTSMPWASNSVRILVMSAPTGSLSSASVTASALSESHPSTSDLRPASE